MYMASILQLLLAIVVFKSDAKCQVEWDDENVVATQLEGSWAINREISHVLAPWSAAIEVKEMK